MNNIGLIRKNKKMTQKELADHLNMTQGNLSKIENGEQPLTLEVIGAISDYLEVEINELITSQYDVEMPSFLRSNKDVLIKYMNVEASAGTGIYSDGEYTKSYMSLSNRITEQLIGISSPVIITVKGNSMSPTLSDGDFVIVDTNNKEMKDGYIYVINIENQLYIKRLFTHPITKEIICKSDNPQHPDFNIRASELDIKAKLIMQIFKYIS